MASWVNCHCFASFCVYTHRVLSVPVSHLINFYPVLTFCALVQLLHKLSVRAADGSQKLLRMIKNPVSDHLPPGCPRICTSFSAGEAVCPRTVVPEGPAAVVIGAFAHGAVRTDSSWSQMNFFLVMLLLISAFNRWMSTTQRRASPSVTTRFLQHWPVLKCVPPLRKSGVSCKGGELLIRVSWDLTR